MPSTSPNRCTPWSFTSRFTTCTSSDSFSTVDASAQRLASEPVPRAGDRGGVGGGLARGGVGGVGYSSRRVGGLVPGGSADARGTVTHESGGASAFAGAGGFRAFALASLRAGSGAGAFRALRAGPGPVAAAAARRSRSSCARFLARTRSAAARAASEGDAYSRALLYGCALFARRESAAAASARILATDPPGDGAVAGRPGADDGDRPPPRGGRNADAGLDAGVRRSGVETFVRATSRELLSALHGDVQSNVGRVPTGPPLAGDMFRMLSIVPGEPAIPHGDRLRGRFFGSARAMASARRRRCRSTTSARFLRSASSSASASAINRSFVRLASARSRTSSSHAAAFAARRSSATRRRSCHGGLDVWSKLAESSHATLSGSSSMRTTGTSVGLAETRVAEYSLLCGDAPCIFASRAMCAASARASAASSRSSSDSVPSNVSSRV